MITFISMDGTWDPGGAYICSSHCEAIVISLFIETVILLI